MLGRLCRVSMFLKGLSFVLNVMGSSRVLILGILERIIEYRMVFR